MAQSPNSYLHPCVFFLCVCNRQTGLLLLGTKESQDLKTIQATLSRWGVKHQRLSSEELKQRFPNIRLDRGEVGLLDKFGGILHASKALRALQVRLYRSKGDAAPDLGILGPSQSWPPPPPHTLGESLSRAGFSLDLWAEQFCILC